MDVFFIVPLFLGTMNYFTVKLTLKWHCVVAAPYGQQFDHWWSVTRHTFDTLSLLSLCQSSVHQTSVQRLFVFASFTCMIYCLLTCSRGHIQTMYMKYHPLDGQNQPVNWVLISVSLGRPTELLRMQSYPGWGCPLNRWFSG